MGREVPRCLPGTRGRLTTGGAGDTGTHKDSAGHRRSVNATCQLPDGRGANGFRAHRSHCVDLIEMGGLATRIAPTLPDSGYFPVRRANSACHTPEITRRRHFVSVVSTFQPGENGRCSRKGRVSIVRPFLEWA